MLPKMRVQGGRYVALVWAAPLWGQRFGQRSSNLWLPPRPPGAPSQGEMPSVHLAGCCQQAWLSCCCRSPGIAVGCRLVVGYSHTAACSQPHQGSSQPERRENPRRDRQGKSQVFSPSLALLTPFPFPCSLAAARLSAGREPSTL